MPAAHARDSEEVVLPARGAPPRFDEYLTDLYGHATAAAIAPSVSALLERFRPLLPPRLAANRRPLSEHDAFLITYPDQIREGGLPPLRTLANFAADHLRELVSGIHILPFYPSSSDDGFSVKDYFAVDPAWGSWDDLASLGNHFELMFDAVFNHASAQGEWFRKFQAGDPGYQDFFVTVSGNPCLSQVVRPRALPLLTEFPTAAGPRRVWTTFSSDQVDLNFANPSVLLRMLEVLLFYVSKGALFIRLDAVAFLWKTPGTTCLHLPQTHRIIQFLRAVLDQIAPQVRLVTETNVPHRDNISYFGDGTNEAQLVYNFALPPLVLNAFQTGNAERLTEWALSLVLPSGGVTFLNFLASHDGVGLNPARGILTDSELDAMVSQTLERGGLVSYKAMPDGSQAPYELNINYLDALSGTTEHNRCESVRSPGKRAESQTRSALLRTAPGSGLAVRKFITAHAIMFSLQGVPAVYFHSLFGSRGDLGAAQSTGINRRINREKLEHNLLKRQLFQPSSLRAEVFRDMSRLLRTRRAHPSLAPAAPQSVLWLDRRVFAVLRESADAKDRLLCLHNVSPESVTLRANSLLSESRRLRPFESAWLRGRDFRQSHRP